MRPHLGGGVRRHDPWFGGLERQSRGNRGFHPAGEWRKRRDGSARDRRDAHRCFDGGREPTGVRPRARHVASIDPNPVPERHQRRVRIRRRHHRLDADSWDTNFATIGAAVVVTSDQGAEQYDTADRNRGQRAVFRFDASARSSSAARRPGKATTPACAATFRSSDSGPGGGRSRAPSSTDWARCRQRLDDARQRGRGGAVGDRRAVRVTELHLPT